MGSKKKKNGTRNPTCTHYTNAGGEYFGGIKFSIHNLVFTMFYLIGLRTSRKDSVFLK